MKNTFSSDCQMILKSKYFMVQFSSDYQMILKSKYFIMHIHSFKCEQENTCGQSMKEKEKAHTKPIAWNLSYQLSLM
ncbi:hypothetical protein T09_2170 [Trichinella sp. T9]|nr:hypothetical protein T09_2170 [Trichinella sp. T9]